MPVQSQTTQAKRSLFDLSSPTSLTSLTIGTSLNDEAQSPATGTFVDIPLNTPSTESPVAAAAPFSPTGVDDPLQYIMLSGQLH
ncbi:hypothetical protein HDU96_010210 [Phlyctochytrium bullatum]|nr:hypothetical protein HDU96_010210 [Phlyctochytrium bullatum]